MSRAVERACEVFPDYDDYRREAFILGHLTAQEDLGWISVKERLPEKGSMYFTCQDIKGEPRSVMTMLFDDGKWYDGDGFRRRIIDYWMPIPELPKKL